MRILDECWEWNGAKNRKGYGVKSVKGVLWLVHRLAYEWTYGPIPDGGLVLHSCDNASCVNPRHLRVGTHLDNARDAVSRRRQWQMKKTHCPQGHPYEGENLIVARKARGGTNRLCRVCESTRRHRRYLRSRERSAAPLLVEDQPDTFVKPAVIGEDFYGPIG